MKIVKTRTAHDLGYAAGIYAAERIRQAISENGIARIVLSTGTSQFETLDVLVNQDIDWSRVVMFHLDEYVGLSIDHFASLRRYMNERFVDVVHPGKAFLVDGENPEESIRELTEEMEKAPIDVSLVGIGENGHIAFNDPPADFDTKESFVIVDLDETCRQQQLDEGWFNSIDEVPHQAVSMTIYRIMQSKCIISAVPHDTKAHILQKMLMCEKTNQIPATILKEHGDFVLFIDENSGSLIDEEIIKKY